MNRCTFRVLFTGIVFAAMMPLSAHPPSKIELSYDDSHRILTMTLEHPTPDVHKHYISRIEVQLNGKPVLTEEFTFQSDAAFHQAVGLVAGAQPGDKITVTAQCNVFGKKTVTLIVPERKAS